jgi:hypothetical protein
MTLPQPDEGGEARGAEVVGDQIRLSWVNRASSPARPVCDRSAALPPALHRAADHRLGNPI